MGAKGGPKTGGRKKGTRNKEALRAQEIAAELGVDPLEYIISVIKDPKSTPGLRLKAAIAACRHLYPTLKAIDVSAHIETGDDQKVILKLLMNGFEAKNGNSTPTGTSEPTN